MNETLCSACVKLGLWIPPLWIILPVTQQEIVCLLVLSGRALPVNTDTSSNTANETRGGRKKRCMYKISDDCWLFAGDAVANGANTATEVEDEREQSACLMIALALDSWAAHQRCQVVENIEFVHPSYIGEEKLPMKGFFFLTPMYWFLLICQSIDRFFFPCSYHAQPYFKNEIVLIWTISTASNLILLIY